MCACVMEFVRKTMITGDITFINETLKVCARFLQEKYKSLLHEYPGELMVLCMIPKGHQHLKLLAIYFTLLIENELYHFFFHAIPESNRIQFETYMSMVSYYIEQYTSAKLTLEEAMKNIKTAANMSFRECLQTYHSQWRTMHHTSTTTTTKSEATSIWNE